MTTVPAQVGDITVAWLNEVLPDDVGRVGALRAEPLAAGVGILGELARLHLDWEDGTGPATLVAKCQSPAPENQGLAAAMGFYLREVNFYRHVADQVDVRVPRAYHADAGALGLPFVLLLEDIEGAHCPDQIAGITPTEAERIIETAALLHAEFWETSSLYALDWLPPMNNARYKSGQAMAEARWPAFAARFGDRVPGAMLATLEDAIARYPDLLDWWVRQGHATFTHTDCRAENYLFGGTAGDDAVTMVDFQLATRHVGAWDVANLLGGSMQADVRRRCEADLIRRYHERVTALGVTGYSLDRCWRDYRASLLQLSVAAVIVSDLQGGNDRGDELMEHLVLRPVLAAADHDVHEVLDDL